MYDALKPPAHYSADSTAETALSVLEQANVAAGFPPNMPRSYEDQPYVREVLARVGFGEPDSWAAATQEEREAAIARVEVVTGDLAEGMQETTNVIGREIVRALSDTPLAIADEAEDFIPDTKRVTSLLDKLMRRYQKPDLCESDPGHCGKPISDAFRFIIKSESPLEALDALRIHFGVPVVWLDGQTSVYEGRNPNNPWSQPGYFSRRAKLFMMLDGHLVLFEVQAYTHDEYERVYRQTHEAYCRARAGQLAVAATVEPEEQES